jgi:hypothetical protein
MESPAKSFKRDLCADFVTKSKAVDDCFRNAVDAHGHLFDFMCLDL